MEETARVTSELLWRAAVVAALVDLPTWLLCGAAAVALLRFRVASTWLVGAGALAGLLLR